MGNSFTHEKPPDLSLEEWTINQGFPSDTNTILGIFDKCGYKTVLDLYWAYNDLEELCTMMPLLGDRSVLRRALTDLHNHNYNHNRSSNVINNKHEEKADDYKHSKHDAKTGSKLGSVYRHGDVRGDHDSCNSDYNTRQQLKTANEKRGSKLNINNIDNNDHICNNNHNVDDINININEYGKYKLQHNESNNEIKNEFEEKTALLEIDNAYDKHSKQDTKTKLGNAHPHDNTRGDGVKSDYNRRLKNANENDDINNKYGKYHNLLNVSNDVGFDLQVKYLANKTDLDAERTLIVGMFEQHQFSHSSVRIIYFDKFQRSSSLPIKIKGKAREARKGSNDNINNNSNLHKAMLKHQKYLVIRIFILQLLVDKKNDSKVILQIKGPLYNRKDLAKYESKEYYQLKTSVQKIIETAKSTMSEYTNYSTIFNNCRHFSQQLIDNVVKNDQMIPNNVKLVNGKEVQLYIDQYFSDSFNEDTQRLVLIQRLTFDQVRCEFDRINPKKICKKGWLLKKSRHTQQWRNRYCVLTSDKKLYTFAQEFYNKDTVESTEEINLDSKLVVKISCKMPTKFYVGEFEFDCGNEIDLHDEKFRFPCAEDVDVQGYVLKDVGKEWVSWINVIQEIRGVKDITMDFEYNSLHMSQSTNMSESFRCK